MADKDVEYSGIVFTVAVNRAAGGTPRMSNEHFAKTFPEQRGDWQFRRELHSHHSHWTDTGASSLVSIIAGLESARSAVSLSRLQDIAWAAGALASRHTAWRSRPFQRSLWLPRSFPALIASHRSRGHKHVQRSALCRWAAMSSFVSTQ